MIEKMIHNFIIKNKAAIMLAGGVVGFIATNYLTAKGAVKRQKRLEEIDHDLTLGEEIKLAAECYGPAIACGAVSAGLIFGGNKTYAAAQAGLVSAYTYLNSRYSKEKQAIVKAFGIEELLPVKNELREPVVEKMKEHCPSPGSILVCDIYNGDPRFLETTMEELMDAEYQINKRLNKYGIASRGDFFGYLGFDVTLADEEVGWNLSYLDDIYDDGSCWLEFSHELVLEGDNCYYYILRFEAEPIAGYRIF